MTKFLWICTVLTTFFGNWVDGFVLNSHEGDPKTEIINNTLMVSFTLIQGADAKGAVWLDGTLPGYYFHCGQSSGKKSWLVHFQGGGWCSNITECIARTKTQLGSSTLMLPETGFTGILSYKAEENPDFFNWNRFQFSLVLASADPNGLWNSCKLNVTNCSPSQLHILQGFRSKMLNALKPFSKSKQNGMFIDSCYAHCQSQFQLTWFADNSTIIGSKTISQSVGDWYLIAQKLRWSIRVVATWFRNDQSFRIWFIS